MRACSMQMILRLLVLSAAACLCFATSWITSASGELVTWCTWLTALTAAGFATGFAWPGTSVWGGLWIAWLQSPLLYWQMHAAGEISAPSRSTGGMAGWAIVTILVVGFSPFPAFASWLGARLRTQRDARRVAPPSVRPSSKAAVVATVRAMPADAAATSFTIGEWLECPHCGFLCDAPFVPDGGSVDAPELVLGWRLPASDAVPAGAWSVHVTAACPQCAGAVAAAAGFEGATLRSFRAIARP
jgi:hypothetical protein